MIETIISFVNETLGTILFFLPGSPFSSFIDDLEDQTFLHWLNWLVPVGTFLKIGVAWLAAISAYYLYSVILRWIKAVD